MKSYAVLPVGLVGLPPRRPEGMAENFLLKNIQVATFK